MGREERTLLHYCQVEVGVQVPYFVCIDTEVRVTYYFCVSGGVLGPTWSPLHCMEVLP